MCFLSAAILLTILEKTHVTHFFNTKSAVGGTPTTPFDAATPEQKQQDAAINAAAKQKIFDKGSSQPTQPTTSNNASQLIDVTAKQELNGSVTIFTMLYGYSGGSCSLTVTNGSSSSNQTAKIIYAPNYSSCAGFSVPSTSGLGAGEWIISLKVDSNGTSSTKTFSFQVIL